MGFDLQAHQELRRLSYQVNCLVRDFCCRAKKCIGISNTGDPNLVLNQQGDWVTNNDSIQNLLSDLPPYLGSKEASEDGKDIGYWYYNTFYNTVSKVTEYIETYAAGKSMIEFTNNGGDDWDIGFKIDPTSKQPNDLAIANYEFIVGFWSAGTDIEIEADTKTTDYTLNTTGNGAGVYELTQTFLDANDEILFSIFRIVKVDGAGNILADYQHIGVAVTAVNGLNMTVTTQVTETNCSNNIEYYAVDAEDTPTQFLLVGSGLSNTLILPTWTLFVKSIITLDPIFTTDFQGQTSPLISIKIN